MSDPVDVLVVGGGPGGYSAAFRCADLGLRTAIVEERDTLGGVCLNVGCIPSKALLHAAAVINEAKHAGAIGVNLGDPLVDVPTLRESTRKVVSTLTGGLAGLAKKREVEVINGRATFASPTSVTVAAPDGSTSTREFRNCIIAVGSRPVSLPGLPDDPRIMDSTGALALADVPKRLLVIGGGIIGLEMATVYDALGSSVTVVEALDQLVPGCDPDLVKPLATRIGKAYEGIHLSTKVTGIDARAQDLVVHLEGDGAPATVEVDRVLVSIGRRANGDLIDAKNASVEVDDRGVIHVDDRMRTGVDGIYAIGDVTGNPMLAHRATHQGHVAAEVIAGHDDAAFDAKVIPSVAYTDPEVAWAGLTETQAKADKTAYEVAAIPWAASGRALTLGRTEGRTKILVDPETRRVLGVGIVGVNAGEMIAEGVLAIEMGAVAEDVALSIHPHPTLSETVGFSAEWAEGTITDLIKR